MTKNGSGKDGDDEQPKRSSKDTQFKKRNPGGPGRGNRKSGQTTRVEQMVQEELDIMLPVAGGLVEARLRLLQQMRADALKGGERAAKWLLEMDVRREAKESAERRELLEWFIPRQAALTDEFRVAEERGLPPPSWVPHPDHLQIVRGELVVTGPLDARGRKAWETLKFQIRGCRDVAAEMRERLKSNDQDDLARSVLETVTKRRRALMRLVPKGWDWNEHIYSLGNPELQFNESKSWSVK